MDALARHIQVSWSGLAVPFLALVSLLFLRRYLPEGLHRRGRTALLLLALSLILRVGATVADNTGASGAGDTFGFLSILCAAYGLTSMAALVVFDLVLGRAGVVVPALVRDILMALAFAVVSMAILRLAGVNILSIITTSAVLTAVIGLALQSTISNLFAGLSLQVDRTLGVGDWVQIGQRIGRIEQIKWRSTFLVTRDGDNVILPNSVLLQNEVLNLSQPTREHRHWLRLGFAYRHPPNDVKRVLLDVARGVPGVLAAPEPDCFPCEFADSAIIYALRYWIDDVQREAPIEGELRTRIWYAAQREGLEIPSPIRQVFTTEVTPDTVARSGERELQAHVAALARIDLFRPLAKEERELLARDMRTASFAAGERIIRQGDEGDSLYIIQSGQVVVLLAVEGVEREVATIKAGEFFGEMSLMTGEPRRATCAAKEDTVCYVIDHRAFERVLAVKPKVAEQISTILGLRQSALESERENLSAEAQERRAAEHSSKLLSRIRNFFNLG